MSNGTSITAVRFPSSTIYWVKVSLGLVLMGLIYYAFFVQPVEAQHATTMNCYIWLVEHWSNVSNYSHGPLIPFIAIGLAWWNLSNQTAVKDRNWNPYWTAVGGSIAILLAPSFVPAMSGYALKLAPFLFLWQVY